MDTNNVTRFEIIDHRPDSKAVGRNVVFNGDDVQLDVELQDDGRTLKVFLHQRYEDL